MYTVYILGRYRVHEDISTNNLQTAKKRVLELEHAGQIAYWEEEA